MKFLIINLSFLITFISFSKEVILKIEASGRGKSGNRMAGLMSQHMAKRVLYPEPEFFKARKLKRSKLLGPKGGKGRQNSTLNLNTSTQFCDLFERMRMNL